MAEAQECVITADEGRPLALAIQVLEQRLPGFLNSERAKKLFGDEAEVRSKGSFSKYLGALKRFPNSCQVQFSSCFSRR